jgi:metallo-beta-lactamase family protein
MMATLQFLGGTGTVTGSKYLLESGGSRVMIDCGLFQGLKELRLRNWEPLPIKPASVNALLLTHAHIDHSGYLPRFVHDGFTGPIYATPGTSDLLDILLPDSARLQEEDALFANRRAFSKHKPALPLYTEKDARAALKRVQSVNYNQEVNLSKSIKARFIPAGHILGSSFIEIEITEPEQAPFKILFSGDVGRYDEPILNDPSSVAEADYLLIESTYGGRLHEKTNPKDRLAEIINAAVERDGKVIIPAFAVGRTQLLIYYLHELEAEGRIPILPVSVDSPMATAATRIYSRRKEDHDQEMQQLSEARQDPLSTRRFSLVHTPNGSKALDQQPGPAIIISASGMATGGRILHHLARFLPDPASVIVLAGYQAEGTRGWRLQEAEKEIKIHGEWIPVRARIENIGSLSAHADQAELLRWLSGFKRPPRTAFIVHGESEGSTALREEIVKKLGWKTVIPTHQQIVELA